MGQVVPAGTIANVLSDRWSRRVQKKLGMPTKNAAWAEEDSWEQEGGDKRGSKQSAVATCTLRGIQ